MDNPSTIDGLFAGTYEFRWASRNGDIYNDGNKYFAIGEFIIDDVNYIVDPIAVPVFTPTETTTLISSDGSISIEDNYDQFSWLQYRLKTNDNSQLWKNLNTAGSIHRLQAGTYEFRWVPKDNNSTYISNSSNEILITENVVLNSGDKIPIPPLIATTSILATTSSNDDCQIYVYGNLNIYSKLQYRLKTTGNTESWENVSDDGEIIGLVAGTYEFQWVGKNGEFYENNENSISTGEQKIEGSIIISKPTNLIIEPNDSTNIEGNNGFFVIQNVINNLLKLQYRLKTSDDSGSWIDILSIPNNDTISNLLVGTYEFRWTPKEGETFSDGQSIFTLEDFVIGQTSDSYIPFPINPSYFLNAPSEKDFTNGNINVANNLDQYSKLQYREKTDDDSEIWVDVPTSGIISSLAAATYEFQWVGKNGETYIDETSSSLVAGEEIIFNPDFISKPSIAPIFTSTPPIYNAGSGATISVINNQNIYSKLQYRLERVDDFEIWIDVPNNGKINDLKAGIYDFRWVGNNGEVYVDGTTYYDAGKTTIVDNASINIPQKIGIIPIAPTVKGAMGNIDVVGSNNAYSQLQYRLKTDDDSETWINVLNTGIKNISPNIYNFRWMSINNNPYFGSTLTSINLDDIILGEGISIGIPTQPKFNSTPPESISGDNGYITVTNNIDENAKLQYRLKTDDDSETWIDVPTSGNINNLISATYQFRWLSKEGEYFLDQESISFDLGEVNIILGLKIPLPSNPNYAATAPQTIGGSDGSITVSDGDDQYSKLQYRLKTDDNDLAWDDVPAENIISDLQTGTYEFRWVGKNGQIYENSLNIEIAAGEVSVEEGVNIPYPKNPSFTLKAPQTIGGSNGSITVSDGDDQYSKLQYREKTDDDSGTWIDLPLSNTISNLKSGIYEFQWKSKNSEAYEGGSDINFYVGFVTLSSGSHIPLPSGTPLYSPTPPQTIGGTDGTVHISGGEDEYSKLQYRLTSANNFQQWLDVPNGEEINGLTTGTYEFRWVGKNGESYDDSDAIKAAGSTTILDGEYLPQPNQPTFTLFVPSIKGERDGSIIVSNGIDQYSKLQYRLKTSDNSQTWVDVYITQKILHLGVGTYEFRWIGKNGGSYIDNSNIMDNILVGDVILSGSVTIPIPELPSFTPTSPLLINGTNGFITISNANDKYSKLQYRLKTDDDSNFWSDINNISRISNLIFGTYEFRWVGKKGEIYEGLNKNTITLEEVTILNGIKIPIPLNPFYTPNHTTVKRGHDGSIVISNGINKYSKLQYRLKTSDNSKTWIDTFDTGVIYNLKFGTYEFRWVGKKGEIFTNGFNDNVSAGQATIIEGNKIHIPLNPILNSFSTSTIDSNNGFMDVERSIDLFSKLQYRMKTENNSESWNDMETATFNTRVVSDFSSDMERLFNLGYHIYIIDKINFAITTLDTLKNNVFNWIDWPTPSDFLSSSLSEDYKIVAVKKIVDLSPGTYEFRWVGKNGEAYGDSNDLWKYAGQAVINESYNIPFPSSPMYAAISPTVIDGNDGKIIISSNAMNKYSKLQYRLKTSDDSNEYHDVPNNNEIAGLESGTYEFRWVGKNGEYYIGALDNYVSAGSIEITANLNIPIPSIPTFSPISPSSSTTSDAIIIVNNFINQYSTLKYRFKNSGNNWQDIPADGNIFNLTSGTYEFKWVGKNNQTYVGGLFEIKITDNVIINSPRAISRPPSINLSNVSPTYINGKDGSIEITNGLDQDSKLQYRIKNLDNDSEWMNVPPSGLLSDLIAADYELRWVPKEGGYYDNTPSNVKISLGYFTVNPSTNIPTPNKATLISHSTSSEDSNDGSININAYNEGFSKLQYRLKTDTNSESWVDVSNNFVDNLPIGTYEFQWVGKNGETYSDGTSSSILIGQITISIGSKIPMPNDPMFTTKKPSFKGADDGSIIIYNATNKYSKLQYMVEGSRVWEYVSDSLKIDDIPSGTYKFRWRNNSGSNYDGTDSPFHVLSDLIIEDLDKITVPSLPSFTMKIPFIKGGSNGRIIISKGQNKYSKLQYRLKTDDDSNEYHDVPTSNEITGLESGMYEFQWVGKNNELFIGTSSNSHFIDSFYLSDGIKISVVDNPTYTTNNPSTNGGSDGSINIINGENIYSKLQYRFKTYNDLDLWKDVKNPLLISDLKSGTYQFRWVGKNGEIYSNVEGTEFILAGETSINDGTEIPVPDNPVYAIIQPSIKGDDDGKIIIENLYDRHSLLQYRFKIEGNDSWINVPSNGEISNLPIGTYEFRWVGINGETYAGTDVTTLPAGEVKLLSGTKLPIPPFPIFIDHGTSVKGGTNGYIEISNSEDNYSLLQYRLKNDDNSNEWTTIRRKNTISGLTAGVYEFQWVGKNGEMYVGGENYSIKVGEVIIDAGNMIPVPSDPNFAMQSPSSVNSSDGTIIVINGTNDYSTLQYRLRSVSDISLWQGVPEDGNIKKLKIGTYEFQWVGKNGEVYSNNNVYNFAGVMEVKYNKANNSIKNHEWLYWSLPLMIGAFVAFDVFVIIVILKRRRR